MLKPSARIFPIGFIISVDAPNFNPHDFYVDGNWERVKGRVIVGVDEAQTEFNTVGKTGGSKTHTLSVNEMPSHTHTYNGFPNGTGSWADPFRKLIYINQSSNPYPGQAGLNYTGGGQAHNNLQPYQTAYIWKLISYSN